jgi:tetratricopeptide (TPR) repeat protein
VACSGAPREALERGDLLYGAGQTDAAVAEYKLALRQRGEEPAVLLRLGNVYGDQGEVEAGLRYLRRLMELDSTYRYQAAAELANAARVARDRGALDNMARAMQPVEALGLGMVPADLRLSMARYYASLSDYGRALPLYLAAAEGDSLPDAADYETARAFQELGGCREALAYFESYLETRGLEQSDRSTARWQYGTCLFAVAEQAVARGRRRSARTYLDLLIEQGVPRTLLDRAHFSRGEILLAGGEIEEAERAFLAVLRLNPARSGPLVQMAEERLRKIRFGR